MSNLFPPTLAPQSSGPSAPASEHWRIRWGAWLASPKVQGTVLGLVLINAVLLGLETSKTVMASFGAVLTALDQAILAIFVVEIAARIAVHRAAFFRDPWGVFDFAVVAIAMVPASGPFAVLRALRVIRVLRVLTVVPSMRRVVGGLLAAIPGLASIGAVLGLLFYVMAVMATNLFGSGFPDWFGSIGRSLYTLFQVMTLESWSMGIVRPVMEVHPFAWMFFVPFILVATFTMLNLFIGVIVSAMQTFHEFEEAHAKGEPVELEPTTGELLMEIRSLRVDVAALREERAAAARPRD